MARWDEYGLKIGTSARDEVLILDSDTNTNKRITVGDIQEFANGKMLEKENTTLNTEAKNLIGAINEVDAKNGEQDKKLKAVGDSLKNEKSERQSEIDVERKKIDNVYANKLVTLDEIDLVTEEGFFVDALAVKELNSKCQKISKLPDIKTVNEHRIGVGSALTLPAKGYVFVKSRNSGSDVNCIINNAITVTVLNKQSTLVGPFEAGTKIENLGTNSSNDNITAYYEE